MPIFPQGTVTYATLPHPARMQYGDTYVTKDAGQVWSDGVYWQLVADTLPVDTFANLPNVATLTNIASGTTLPGGGIAYTSDSGLVTWTGLYWSVANGQTGAQGPQGPAGPQGATGPTGATGSPGTPATIAVGTVAGLAAGATPTVINSGTSSNAVFNFGIPAGVTGATGATGPQGPQGPSGAGGGNALYASTQTGIFINSSNDSTAGLQAAITSVAGTGNTLVLDGPITCVIGTDYTKSIFVPAGVNFYAQPGATITCDNIMVALFVFQHAQSSRFDNLQINYIGAFGEIANTYGGGTVTAFGAVTGGTGYTNGTYSNCRLSGAAFNGTNPGDQCYATIVVAGGAVSAVTLKSGGIWGGGGFTASESVSCSNIYLGGAGSGFSVVVSTVVTTTNASLISTAANNAINVTYKNYNVAKYVAGVSGNQYINGATPSFGGSNNQAALIQIRGASHDVTLNNLQMMVPVGASASRFIPMCIALTQDYSPGTVGSGSGTSAAITATGAITNGGSGYLTGFWPNCPVTGGSGTQATVDVTVSGAIPGVSTGTVSSVVINRCGSGYTAADTGLSVANTYLGGVGSGLAFNVSTVGATLQNLNNFSIPTNLTINNPIFDGYAMGLAGAGINLKINGLEGRRYTDIQNSYANDPLALQVGGVNTWYPPPHMIYINTLPAYTSFISHQFENCVDWGIKVGTAVVRSSGSGIVNAYKFPIQYNCSFINCRSYRVEGGFQFFSFGTPGGVVDNFYSECVSTSGMNVKPGDAFGSAQGVVFPGSNASTNMFFRAKCIDKAPIPVALPFGSDSLTGHTDSTFDFDMVTPDWPLTNYSIVNSIGQTITSTYGANHPSIGVGGSGNSVKAKVKFLAMTSTTTFKGFWINSGASADDVIDLEIIGWRNWNEGGVNDGLRPRINIASTNAVYNTNTFVQRDTNNQTITNIDGAMMTETITIDANVTPTAGAGAYTVSAISMPTNAICTKLLVGVTTSVGSNTFEVGDSGSATRFYSSVSMAAVGGYQTPFTTPVALSVNPTVLVLTPVGGSWLGTGNIYIAATFQRLSVPG